MTLPNYILVQKEENDWEALREPTKGTTTWQSHDGKIVVDLLESSTDGFVVIVQKTPSRLKRLQLEWTTTVLEDTLVLGNAFERSYGDLGFDVLNEDKNYHWYVLLKDSKKNRAFGVKIQPNALCAWKVYHDSIDLIIDIRSGTNAINLRSRELSCCTVVLMTDTKQNAFLALKHFCQTLAIENAMVSEPYIGSNDWYYAYGNNSDRLVVDNARFMSELCQNIPYEPWVVIDDGWQVDHAPDQGYNGGPWTDTNPTFPDMEKCLSEMKEIGVRPGLWFRPLLRRDDDFLSNALRIEAAGQQHKQRVFLDPSHPLVKELIVSDIKRFKNWGVKMIKHDFTTVDIFGCWGHETTLDYFRSDTTFYDREKTTAEIIKDFYRLIKDTAVDIKIIGCNTLSHLSAGIFELMRIGDDTSGVSFERTVSRGVNALAFRLAQHEAFYAADADCIGISEHISWDKN